MTAFYQK
jgi:hypothetical protein